MNVVQMPEPWRTKEQIADYYGYTTRWVDLKVAEGMPMRIVGGRRRFRISLTDEWLEKKRAA